MTCKRAAVALVAMLAAFTLSGCAGISKVDPERYKMGYLMGKTGVDLGDTPEQAVEQCKKTADFIAEKADWDSGERLDYMLGCQDSAHGRKSDY